jgi:hypothetical protein
MRIEGEAGRQGYGMMMDQKKKKILEEIESEKTVEHRRYSSSSVSHLEVPQGPQ